MEEKAGQKIEKKNLGVEKWSVEEKLAWNLSQVLESWAKFR